MTSSKLISQTQNFVKKSFIEYPHYSFGHWSIMYNHSVSVKKYAKQLLNHIKADRDLVLMGALLHDIGKTFLADPKILHKKHEELNFKVAEKFLNTLKLPKERLTKFKKILRLKGKDNEQKIIKDADRLAFYSDKILYTKFIKWALADGEKAAIKRKLIKKLNFKISEKIGHENYLKMKKDWDNLMNKNKHTKILN